MGLHVSLEGRDEVQALGDRRVVALAGQGEHLRVEVAVGEAQHGEHEEVAQGLRVSGIGRQLGAHRSQAAVHESDVIALQ